MWGVSRTLTLIKDLHNTPCLWDVQYVDYKNRSKKDEALEALGRKYGICSSGIEKKIQSLKNQFRREHRKFTEAKRIGSRTRVCRWFGYESLSFLLQVYESRGSRTPIDDVEDASERYYDVTPEDCDTEDAGDEGASDGAVSEGMGVDRQAHFRQPFLQRKRPYDEPIARESFKCLKLLTETISRRDEYSVYGEHIANKLKYSGRSRSEIAIAQRRIDEICFQLAMGSFSQHSHLNTYTEPQQTMQNSLTHFEDDSQHSSPCESHPTSPNTTTSPVPQPCAEHSDEHSGRYSPSTVSPVPLDFLQVEKDSQL